MSSLGFRGTTNTNRPQPAWMYLSLENVVIVGGLEELKQHLEHNASLFVEQLATSDVGSTKEFSLPEPENAQGIIQDERRESKNFSTGHAVVAS